MARRIKRNKHQTACYEQVRSLLTNADLAAGNTGNQPLADAVRGLLVLEDASTTQIQQVVDLTEGFIKANAVYAAATKTEETGFRDQEQLEASEKVDRGQARVYSGEPFQTAAITVRAALLGVIALLNTTFPEPPTA